MKYVLICGYVVTVTVFEVDPSLANPSDLTTDPSLAASARDEYNHSRSGPLTVLPCSICYLPFSQAMPHEALTSIVSASSAVSASLSEREHILHSRLSIGDNLGQIEYIFDLGNWSTFFDPDLSQGKKYGTMLQILQHPFSKGTIHIRPNGSTVTDKPIIDPQYYSGLRGHLDLEIMTQCQRFAHRISETKPLADIIRGRVFPPPDISDDELREWVVQTTVTDWHPVGTCAMGGSGGIRTGVVDERLRVYGVGGLRVVDASIMPLQISAHLQATVYAIGEKAAHMILQDHKV